MCILRHFETGYACVVAFILGISWVSGMGRARLGLELYFLSMFGLFDG